MVVLELGTVISMGRIESSILSSPLSRK
uniref:Uncharacterized protein n=1 Tax=Arundo donax TaxID=35708 RepID=A0A0A9GZB7_ARUDO